MASHAVLVRACTATSDVIKKMSKLDDYEARSYKIAISGNIKSH